MTKRKSRAAMSGISGFVRSMNTQHTRSNMAKATVQVADVENGATSLSPVRDTEPPPKRQKVDDGTSDIEKTAGDHRWIKKYDATGLAPHYTSVDQVPEHLQKYFSQRYRYFSLYSTHPGCLLDEEGWFSVTPELVANQIADRCRCDTVLDAFCGVGGSAIAFAMTCQRVITLDTSPTRLALARHNAQIYGVADRIEFVLSDFLSFAKSYSSLPSLSRDGNPNPLDARKIDVIFLSPPWGGPSYINGFSGDSTPLKDDILPAPTSDSNHPSYSLSSIQPIHGRDLFDLARKITRNVVYYLPRSTRLEEVSALLSDEDSRTGSGRTEPAIPERVEIEEEWMGGKLKVLACYFGGLVRGQEHLF